MDKSLTIQPPTTKSMAFLVNPSAERPLSQVLTQFRITAGSQKAWIDNVTGLAVYFRTPPLSDATHKIDITTTGVNESTLFAVDYFLIVPTAGGSNSGVATSRSAPAPSTTQTTIPIVTSHATPVGPIVGGVVGGIAGIVIVAFAVWYFLKKRSSGGRAYYFEKPSPADMLAGEGP